VIALNQISAYSILLPGGMVFFLWRALAPSYRALSTLVLFTLLMETIGKVTYELDINNMLLFRLYTYFEAVLLIFYYRRVFTTRELKLFCSIMLIAFLLFSVGNLFPWNWERFARHNSIQRGVECIWAIILCVVFYINLFNQSTVTNLTTYPHFWMTSGFLLYFAGTMFQSILMDTYQTTELIQFDISDIHACLNIFLNIIYTIVLWMASRESISE